MGGTLMCILFDDGRLAEAITEVLEAEVGFLDKVAKTVASVARQVAPIATAIPIPQAQIIGGVADLIVNAWADTIDALADEWRAELDDGAR
jgi:hypothetical protein